MKATIKEAANNERGLTITPAGYGHWKISATYRGKELRAKTNNSEAVDNFRSDPDEKDDYGVNRRKNGYETLLSEIIRKNEY